MPISDRVVSGFEGALQNAGVPNDLIRALLDAADEMTTRYAAGDHRPSELNASDFVEASFRVLEHLAFGRATRRDRSLPPIGVICDNLESSQLDDSLRIHVPRLLRGVYDIRNRRGVGHLPGPVSANRSDAELVLAIVKWVITEFIRIYHDISHAEAQALIDNFVVHRPVVVEVFEHEPRIVTSGNLSMPDSILVLLLWHEPDLPIPSVLATWLRSPINRVTQAIRRLDDRDLVHVTASERVHLTTPGRNRAVSLIAEHWTT